MKEMGKIVKTNEQLLAEIEALNKQLVEMQQASEEKCKDCELFYKTLLNKTIEDTFFVDLDKYNRIPNRNMDFEFTKEELLYLANIVRDSNDSLVVTDFNGYVLAWNNVAEQTYNFSKSIDVNSYLKNSTAESEREDILSVLTKLKLLENIKPFDSRRITKKKIIIDVVLNFTLLNNSKGKPAAVAIVEHDITERKKFESDLISAKEKAIESSKLKSILITNLNHELRTPLNEIIGFSKILKYDTSDPEILEIATFINRSSIRLYNTLESIITLSQTEAHLLDLKLEQIYLINDIYEIVDNFLSIAKEKNISLEVGLKDITLFANLDERLFVQSLSYIVENAIKFTNEGSVVVDLQCEIEDEDSLWAVIKVRDTGIGIKKEMFGIIFEEFRQIDEKLSRSYEGVGLGLTLARNMIELMNGTICVESELGVGSTFTIKYPAYKVK